MDLTIRIKNLRLRTVLGVDQAERQRPQEVMINVAIALADSAAADSDDLADTIDYSALEQSIADRVESRQFHLLEKLAGCIMEIVRAEPKVGSAVVEVAKPAALKRADAVSVVCTWQRG